MVIIGIAIMLGVLFVMVIVRKNFTNAIAPRKIYYEHTMKLIAQKPFLGHGLEAFSDIL